MPSVFIPLLEEVGQIIPVGEWTMRRSCAQVSTWRALSGREFIVSLNLSPAQFDDEDLETKLLRAAKAAGLPTSSVALDIEADVLLGDAERSKRVLESLRKHDIKICMDNFGVGKAPLQTLASLPLDVVKFHQSLIQAADSADGAKVIRCAIAMVQSLGVHALAKGVEEEAQLKLLEDARCPFYQGKLYSSALSDIQTTCWVQKSRAPAWG